MKVIKRDGHMVDWCPEKVENAILKANNEVEESGLLARIGNFFVDIFNAIIGIFK